MSLLEQVELVWSQGAEEKAAGWAEKLRGAEVSILSAKQRFHEWYPLKVYLSYSTATNPKTDFSLRYLGQEVATLRVEPDGEVLINISTKTALANERFGAKFQGKLPWRGTEAQKFRKQRSIMLSQSCSGT